MEIGQRLAANLRQLRKQKGWSQEELGDRCGLHRTYISQIERVTKSPTIAAVDRIAQALDVRVGVLLD